MMPSLDCVLQLRPFIPWVCTSLALGYAAYIHWRMQKVQALASKLQINKDKQLNSREEVNIDTVDRNVTKKKISYCRCWKSKNFPFCDGAHKYHNRENDDKTGPLVLVWNEPDNSSMMESTITDPDRDMDIKSIDSESPILQSSNGDSNGEFDQIVKIHNSSDEQLSSLEMIEDNFAAPVEVEGDFKVIETQHN